MEADRGGDVTYHGPGQLVAYPILDLKRRGLSIRQYLRMLEGVIVDFLARYGVRGERVEGFTGVWVDGAKVAAIGIGVHNWVSFHGVAINIDPNMEHFRLIVPCGIPDKPVTFCAISKPIPRLLPVTKIRLSVKSMSVPIGCRTFHRRSRPRSR